MRVHLQTTARRIGNGKLKVLRQIPEVFEVEHFRSRQPPLFGDDSTDYASVPLNAAAAGCTSFGDCVVR
jgi:hypothetical protein